MKNRLADRRGGWVADCSLCRSWVAVKIFVFVISQDFHEIFNFVFRQIFLKFHEIQNNFVKISWDTKSCFAATLCRSGVNGGAGRCSPGTPSALTQIVPYSSSLYTVFHSVIYNSVLDTYNLPFHPVLVGLFSPWEDRYPTWRSQGDACHHRTRIKTEEKAKVVSAVMGTEYIQFLVELVILL